MILKRDGLRQECKVIKADLKKAFAHYKNLKNSKPSADQGQRRSNVLVLPHGHDPKLTPNPNPDIAVNTAVAAAAMPSNSNLLPALSVRQQASDLDAFNAAQSQSPMNVNVEGCEDIQDFVKFMYVIASDGHENSRIERRKVTGERSTLTSFLDAADMYCRQTAEDPTLRPYYSEVDPVNVRKTILRSRPLPTDFFRPEDFASNG